MLLRAMNGKNNTPRHQQCFHAAGHGGMGTTVNEHAHRRTTNALS